MLLSQSSLRIGITRWKEDWKLPNSSMVREDNFYTNSMKRGLKDEVFWFWKPIYRYASNSMKRGLKVFYTQHTQWAWKSELDEKRIERTFPFLSFLSFLSFSRWKEDWKILIWSWTVVYTIWTKLDEKRIESKECYNRIKSQRDELISMKRGLKVLSYLALQLL